MLVKISTLVLAGIGTAIIVITFPIAQWMFKNVNGLEHLMAHLSFMLVVFLVGLICLMVAWKLFRRQ